jgi:hypothetical protein
LVPPFRTHPHATFTLGFYYFPLERTIVSRDPFRLPVVFSRRKKRGHDIQSDINESVTAFHLNGAFSVCLSVFAIEQFTVEHVRLVELERFIASRTFSNGQKDPNPFDEEEWEDDPLVDHGEPGVKVKALYDYDAMESDEISFKSGMNTPEYCKGKTLKPSGCCRRCVREARGRGRAGLVQGAAKTAEWASTRPTTSRSWSEEGGERHSDP